LSAVIIIATVTSLLAFSTILIIFTRQPFIILLVLNREVTILHDNQVHVLHKDNAQHRKREAIHQPAQHASPAAPVKHVEHTVTVHHSEQSESGVVEGAEGVGVWPEDTFAHQDEAHEDWKDTDLDFDDKGDGDCECPSDNRVLLGVCKVAG
jgi:hypothetical protein